MTTPLTLSQVIAAARDGRYQPVHVIVGEETLLIERAVGALRRAVVGEAGVASGSSSPRCSA